MIRFGLCCIFREEPIRFRATTATSLVGISRVKVLVKLSEICLHNSRSLQDALAFCGSHGIGSFRIQSGLMPLRTHPRHGYALDELPDVSEIRAVLERCRLLASRKDIRTTFHPDQFVVLNSPRPEVVASSLGELEHHGEMAELVGADVINVHAGGVYGDKEAALDRLASGISRLSRQVRNRLTLENDDRCYTPLDLLPLCWREQIPLVYDVHHHRCLPDGFSIKEATEMAITTWNREPLFHISSPILGWKGPTPERHYDFVDAGDFPAEWLELPITVEIEAKAKELAVMKLINELDGGRKKASQFGHL
ncbi:MAG: UV DNA damage repair endonuclease UvsE [candidate division Zixibacteria bacterium]|nr:UV DNA damage repair endonuclease UvsE [candidate division Zixibacteria bacterium]